MYLQRQLEEELRAFRENGITRDRITEITGLQSRVEQLETDKNSLSTELEAARQQAYMNAGAAQQLAEEQSRTASQKTTIAELMDELNKRKQVSRADMLRPIQTPPVLFEEPEADWDPEDLAREDDWLDHIQRQSQRSGIIFSGRQLMAYHTCLKIGEWAPLVVLSGVSGTGKSELPKQYAIHGGMQFLSLPVNPDWDSPASLFGFCDALAFKMMPKLRGLEVRGQNERCIDQIRQCLAKAAGQLVGDFENACSMTSEVFQWNSAAFMGL